MNASRKQNSNSRESNLHGALERMVREGPSDLKLNDEKEPMIGDLGRKQSRFREQQVQTRNKVSMFKEQKKSLVWLEQSGLVEGRAVENEAKNGTCLVSRGVIGGLSGVCLRSIM